MWNTSISINKINIKKIFVFISVWVIYLSYMPRQLNGNNLIYAIGEIHTYNNTVFNSNVFMADGVISPRWMLDVLFAFFMKLTGGSWQDVAVLYIHIGVIVFCVATFLIGYRISEQYGHLLAVLFAYLVITCAESQVGGFNLREMDSIGMGMGKAFVILAIAYTVGKKKRFDLSWLFIAIAAVMHVHEGVYGFVIVFILCFFENLRKAFSLKKNWSILVSIIVILASVIPNMITDKLNITNEEFVYIYATYRHPHHLVPSTWDRKGIILSFIIILFPFVLSIIKEIAREVDTKELIINIVEKIVFIFAWIAVLIIMFIGTEKFNIVSITTLFGAKFFKYIGLLAMISYLEMVGEFLCDGRMIAAVAIAIFAITVPQVEVTVSVLFYTIFLAYIYVTTRYGKKQEYEKDIAFKMICLLIAATVIVVYGGGNLRFVTGIVFLFLMIEMLFSYCQKHILKVVMMAMTFFLMGYSLNRHLFEMSNGILNIENATNYLVNVCGTDIYELANNFREKTDTRVQYLSDPDAESSSGWFQIIAERNCYVLYKVIPSSKAMMKEWYDRYQLTQGLLDKSTGEVVGIMKNIGIEYLLVDKAHYANIEDSQDFTVFTECSGDTYRVYKLNDSL